MYIHNRILHHVTISYIMDNLLEVLSSL